MSERKPIGQAITWFTIPPNPYFPDGEERKEERTFYSLEEYKEFRELTNERFEKVRLANKYYPGHNLRVRAYF